ncbi:MAG: hypothetical protein U1G07_14420 [Verrucomicrobiota bacterium]
METTPGSPDQVFRRIVLGSTSIGFACMLGSLAAVRMRKGAGWALEWHWSIPIFVVAIVVWNWRFWKAVWEAQDHPSAAAKRRFVFHLIGMVLLGVGAFLYPVLLVEHNYRQGIFRGLLIGAGFLGTLAWLIYTVGKGFAQADAIELKRQSKQP